MSQFPHTAEGQRLLHPRFPAHPHLSNCPSSRTGALTSSRSREGPEGATWDECELSPPSYLHPLPVPAPGGSSWGYF